MTAYDEDSQADEEGLGRRQNSGQFRKGQSGNPRGRPRKEVARPILIPARFPTREVLRAEASRTIAVNGASGRETLSIREAIMRALSLSALRGGVYAQRTILELLMAEDERLHRERKESFEFWQDYKQRCKAVFAEADKAGKDKPDLLPHPDDIKFNLDTFEVRFLGAVDDGGRAAEKIACELQALAYEMSIFACEDNYLPSGNGEDGRLGPYMALYVLIHVCLPPRLRLKLETCGRQIMARVALGHRAWEQDLERRCRAIGLPFKCHWIGDNEGTKPFAKLGIKWPARPAR